ncbi:MAG: HAMP domain-containing sensor histidine kinase [Coriobacteriia bacterium]
MSAARLSFSTSVRVALAVTTVLAAGAISMVTIGRVAISNRLADDIDRTLTRETAAFAAGVASTDGTEGLIASARTFLGSRSSAGSASTPILLLRVADGRLVSNAALALETAPGNRTLLRPATSRRGFVTLIFQKEPYRVAVVPVRDTAGKTVAVLEAALSLAPSRRLAAQVAWTLAVVGALVVAAGAALSAGVARTSLAPLHAAARTVDRIGQTSLSERVRYVGPPDDVGLMVGAVNDMLDRLDSAFDEQRRFVADASHELRTPLTVVRGHLDVMSHAGGLTHEQEETLALVDDELRRMSRLVEDLLALARLDAGQPRKPVPLEVGPLVDTALARAKALGDRSWSIDCERGVRALADPDMLGQALLNLLANAVAHTSPGGSISLAYGSEGDRAVIRVADDGPGVPPQDRQRIFERFYRAAGPRPASGGGSGLGLAITKRLLELLGGEIRVEEAPNGGAVFVVRLRTP